MKAIADTGFLVAHLNGRDIFHKWAIELAPLFEKPVLTCEPVLTEAAYLLRSPGLLLGLLRDGLLKVEFDIEENRESLERLGADYADQGADLCDLCVVRMSEIFPQHQVLTTDRRDFTIYPPQPV